MSLPPPLKKRPMSTNEYFLGPPHIRHEVRPPKRIPNHIRARVAMINGNFGLPKKTKAAMVRVREIISEAGEALNKLLEDEQGLKFDAERFAAALDKLQAAKDTACAALTLPHHKNED